MDSVQISELPIATSANNADSVLLRKGLTDYQCTVALLRQIDLTALPLAPNPCTPTDRLLLSQSGGSYAVNFNRVGLVRGVRIWFWMSTAPTGWVIVPGGGDSLIAVAGGSVYTTAGVRQGTWQQPDTQLTLQQIPNHRHSAHSGDTDTSTNIGKYPRGSKSRSGGNLIYDNGIVGSNQPIPDSTDPIHQTQLGAGHNHGSSWRPMACVGNIFEKAV